MILSHLWEADFSQKKKKRPTWRSESNTICGYETDLHKKPAIAMRKPDAHYKRIK